MGFPEAPAGGEEHPASLWMWEPLLAAWLGLWGAFVDGNVLLLLDSGVLLVQDSCIWGSSGLARLPSHV